MTFGKQLRGLLLVATFVGVLVVLGRSILRPAARDRPVTTFVFPPEVPLPGWQPLESSPLAEKSVEHPGFVAGRRYHYSRSGLPLDIEMRYLRGSNLSFDVKPFIQRYTSIPLSPGQPLLIRQQGSGFYGLLTYKERAYLSACITPRGGSTVTYEQFNRLTYEVQFSRLPQLLGQQSFVDRRCLWAHLSIPIKQSPDAYPVLEKAWLAWYQWWSPRFPKR